MSQPELSDPNTVVSGSPQNFPLKLAGLAAGIPILFLGQELDSEGLMVFLTLLFFLGAYLLIGFVPARMLPFQVGFAAGYAFSMLVALVVYFFLRSLGSTSAAPVSAYEAALLLNFALLTTAVITWIRLRKRIDNGAAISPLMLGLGYPFLAFVLILLVGSMFLR